MTGRREPEQVRQHPGIIEQKIEKGAQHMNLPYLFNSYSSLPSANIQPCFKLLLFRLFEPRSKTALQRYNARLEV